jgi:hypothetical protein
MYTTTTTTSNDNHTATTQTATTCTQHPRKQHPHHTTNCTQHPHHTTNVYLFSHQSEPCFLRLCCLSRLLFYSFTFLRNDTNKREEKSDLTLALLLQQRQCVLLFGLLLSLDVGRSLAAVKLVLLDSVSVSNTMTTYTHCCCFASDVLMMEVRRSLSGAELSGTGNKKEERIRKIKHGCLMKHTIRPRRRQHTNHLGKRRVV